MEEIKYPRKGTFNPLIGGWLLIYVIAISIRIVIKIYSVFSEAWFADIEVHIVSNIVWIIASIFIIWYLIWAKILYDLVKLKPKSIRKNKIMLISTPFVELLILFLYCCFLSWYFPVAGFGDLLKSAFNSEVWSGFLMGIFSAAIWLAYFRGSSRVAAVKEKTGE